MQKVLCMSLPQLFLHGHMDTNTIRQAPGLLSSWGWMQIPVQKSWWAQPLCSPSGLTWPQCPRSLPEPPWRLPQLVERQEIWRKVFFQVGLPQKQHRTAVLSIINWKKYQRNAEVHSLWLGRDLNLCLPVCRGCLLLRAEPTSFHMGSKQEADTIKTMYWLASLKTAAATKFPAGPLVKQHPFRHAWWKEEINPLF